MDVDYCKQTVGGIAAPKKRSVTAGSKDGTPQFCNRIGCCGRLNHTKGTKAKCLDKPKPLKPSIRSSSGKDVTGSCSKNSSSVPNVKKSVPKSHKKLSAKIEKIPPGIRQKAVLMPISKTTEGASSSTRIRGSSLSSAPQITDQGVMGNGEKSRYGLKSQNNESNIGRRRKFFQGESSSSGKGKRVIGISANEGRPPVSTFGSSVSDPRNSRNLAACRPNGVSSVRTRRSLKMDPSKGDNLSMVQSVNAIPNTSAETSSTESSVDVTSSATSSVASSTDHPVVRFVDHNGTRSYNIDGIADVLLALDRIEQDEELTYEQLLSLEANLFLGGLNLYDQHRDMRLDIDNMSYEELLALEEKMGTVSIALSEEELSKCIRISIYECLQLEDGRKRHSWGGEEIKCSICQEEYVRGDKIGRLGCKHGYHNSCINQWLSLKNWCPICKASPNS